MSDVKVSKNELVFNGWPYFRGGSIWISLADVGKIRKPVTGANLVDKTAELKIDKIGVKKVGPLKMDYNRTSKTDFAANDNLMKIFGEANVEHAIEAMRKDELELFYVEADKEKLIKEINESPKIKEELRRLGNAARVIMGGFVVMKAKTSQTFGSSTDVEASVTVKGVTISPKVGNSSNGDSSVTYPPGAYFAYLPAKLRWDHKNEKKATKVIALDRDRHGL